MTIAACRSGPPEADTSKITSAEVATLAAANGDASQPWKKFIFDIQVKAPDGNLLPQTNGEKYLHMDISDTRVLRPAGSIGADANGYSVQTSTGIWLEPHLGKERARVFLDYGWPRSEGKIPNDLSKASVVKAHIACEPWAQALAAGRPGHMQYDRLKEVLSSPIETSQIAAAEPSPAYKIGEYWIIPVVVTLAQYDFGGQCF